MFGHLWAHGAWEGTTPWGSWTSPGLTCYFSLKVQLEPVVMSSFLTLLRPSLDPEGAYPPPSIPILLSFKVFHVWDAFAKHPSPYWDPSLCGSGLAIALCCSCWPSSPVKPEAA